MIENEPSVAHRVNILNLRNLSTFGRFREIMTETFEIMWNETI